MTLFRHLLPIAISSLALTSTAGTPPAGPLFVKEAIIPADADSLTRIDIAARVVPSPGQMAWQELEMTAFLHFGINTFTDREWGEGNENPALFNPVGLDADQWVRTLRDAGFKMVILTAKHHDGFCLWPSATTSHTVAASPWKDGQGDVVRDLREACNKYGMKLGLYLSPWDRNAECYGDSPRYNQMFTNQLTELLSNYGKVDEVWFDGACGEGPNGKKQVYDWATFKKVIRQLQPDAVTAIMGDDVRWVGNENGTGRLTEWSVTPKVPGSLPGAEETNSRLKLDDMAADLGSRQILMKADSLRWWPSEVDVSIRPGWFYHDSEQPKSLRHLVDIYLNSVGRNSVLLLNVPPDRNGRIASADSTRLMELRNWISTNLTDNLVAKREPHSLTASLRPDSKVNCVVLGEDISRGQHVERFTVSALTPDGWRQVARGTTIGYKRILHFPEVEASQLRIDITSQRAPANIATFCAYDTTLPPDADDSRPTPVYPGENIKVMSIDGQTVPVEAMVAAFDNDPSTLWTSPATGKTHEIIVDLGKEVDIDGIIYTPRTDGNPDGTVFKYEFALSNNAKDWNVASRGGEFSNVVNNPIPQRVFLASPAKARYLRFTSRSEVNELPFITIASLQVITANENN